MRISESLIVIVLEDEKNGCGARAIKIPVTAENRDLMVSLAMSALVSRKKVKAKGVSCSNSPWENTAASSDITVSYE